MRLRRSQRTTCECGAYAEITSPVGAQSGKSSIAPSRARSDHDAGILPVGSSAYELADGSVHQYRYGLAQIEFMGELTAGRVIFAPEGTEPRLGVTALESVGIMLDPATKTLTRLPAVPLK
jgi:hypothetical protein